MNRKLLNTVVFLSFGALFPFASSASECPVTLQTNSPVETGLSDTVTHDWYGSEKLAALIPKDGHWMGMGPESDYGDKFWWWRKGFNAKTEARPDLIVTASRIDVTAPSVETQYATSGWNSTWNAMLVGMEFPTSGCWKVTGRYAGETVLTVVLLVGSKSN